LGRYWPKALSQRIFGDGFYCRSPHDTDAAVRLGREAQERRWHEEDRQELPDYFAKFGVIDADTHLTELRRKALPSLTRWRSDGPADGTRRVPSMSALASSPAGFFLFFAVEYRTRYGPSPLFAVHSARRLAVGPGELRMICNRIAPSSEVLGVTKSGLGSEAHTVIRLDSPGPSRLHLRLALTLPGRSEGEGGRGTLLSSPSRARIWIAPTIPQRSL
jgi:hypothetical protein